MDIVTNVLDNLKKMITDNTSFLEPINALLRKQTPENQGPINLIWILVFMFQMIFGGLGVVLVPQKIINLGNSAVTRIILLTLIGFVATKNLALALVGALAFALILYLLRDDKNAAPVF